MRSGGQRVLVSRLRHDRGTRVAEPRATRHLNPFKESFFMTRNTIFASAAMALTLVFGAGCDKAADDQRKANEAQAEADKKIAEANRDNTTKTTSAQVEADKKIAAAESDFGKRRE